MCGIVGYIGKEKQALPVLIDGLKRLEYRGYDSAGIAFLETQEIKIIKCKGKIEDLEKIIDDQEKSNLGIGHTRWATHGVPNQINSHPHSYSEITIVHNGIIENYYELKQELVQKGYEFKSETDTEVACILIEDLYQQTKDIHQTIKCFFEQVKGAYAIGLIIKNEPNKLYAIKKDSPLIIALGKEENYLASDVPAILQFTNKYLLLEDFEYAEITKDKITCFNQNSQIIEKSINEFSGKLEDIQKKGYEHFMLKEMMEQPIVFKNTTEAYTEKELESLMALMPDFTKYEKLHIVACGSAYHTGLVGKTILEEYADIPVEIEIASEFRYKKNFLNKKTLVIVISQSGETADTLAAIKIAKGQKVDTLGIINVVESSIARQADIVLYTKAGNEIAVATTKAYLAQITMLSLITLSIANKKEILDKHAEIFNDIKKIPTLMEQLLNNRSLYQEIANDIYKHNNLFFIGRGVDYALALEGSLKLKEISYIHSEAYPAGELKHGTISLIEEGIPVFGIITNPDIQEKTMSNIKEVKSRGAKIILINSQDTAQNTDVFDKQIIIPVVHKILQPILAIIPLQMIAYETAKLRGCNIDQPKNLAKSVTVE